MAYYFVQHGLALSKDQDPARRLSPEGESAVMRVATHLRQHNISLSGIFHSGKTRAHQTALLFSQQLAVDNVSELTGMNPSDDVADFASALQDNDNMYIGHLPHLERVVSYLITGNENAAVVKFTNAAVVCIKQVESEFYIDWVLSPAIC
tara:strand:- start:76 stop:525 length:450 start_codon:yes stop_codon:yes gene_type:complete